MARTGEKLEGYIAGKAGRRKFSSVMPADFVPAEEPIFVPIEAATVADPGLDEARRFSEELLRGDVRILTPAEDEAAWQESDRRMAELEEMMAEKFGTLKLQ